MIIFGTRSYARVLATLMLVCQRCGNPAAHRVVERVMRFTLFFIPLFPISSKRVLTCTFCGQTTPISKELAAQYEQTANQPQLQQYPQPQQYAQPQPPALNQPAPYGQPQQQFPHQG